MIWLSGTLGGVQLHCSRSWRHVEDVQLSSQGWEDEMPWDTSWEEQGRGEKSWAEGEERWNNLELLKRVAKIEKSWDGVRRAETRWSQLKRDEAKWRRTQRTELRSCKRSRGISYRQKLLLGPKSSTLLIIGNFRQPACPGFTCNSYYQRIYTNVSRLWKSWYNYQLPYKK